MGDGERRIELTVRRVEDSLCGMASDATGEQREFTGWLGLLGVLEAMLAAPHTASQLPNADESMG